MFCAEVFEVALADCPVMKDLPMDAQILELDHF